MWATSLVVLVGSLYSSVIRVSPGSFYAAKTHQNSPSSHQYFGLRSDGLRWLHLAPDQPCEAIANLNEQPILALAMARHAADMFYLIDLICEIGEARDEGQSAGREPLRASAERSSLDPTGRLIKLRERSIKGAEFREIRRRRKSAVVLWVRASRRFGFLRALGEATSIDPRVFAVARWCASYLKM